MKTMITAVILVLFLLNNPKAQNLYHALNLQSKNSSAANLNNLPSSNYDLKHAWNRSNLLASNRLLIFNSSIGVNYRNTFFEIKSTVKPAISIEIIDVLTRITKNENSIWENNNNKYIRDGIYLFPVFHINFGKNVPDSKPEPAVRQSVVP